MAWMTRILVVLASCCLFGSGYGYAEIRASAEHAEVLKKRLHGRHQHYQDRTSLKSRPGGELSFEVLRMLSVGMSKVEVMSRAGAPRYTLRQFGSSAWVYSSTDQWIVELTFAAGRVIAINWTRP
jgi:hypothetical protein